MWKFVNSDEEVANRINANGTVDSRLVTDPEIVEWVEDGNTIEAADPAIVEPDLDAELATAIAGANTLVELKDALLGTNQNYRVGGKPK